LSKESAEAMRGQRQMTWSRGLRERAGMEEEKTTSDMVEDIEEGYVLLATINVDDWRAIVSAGERGVVLDCAARGDEDMMRSVISECRKEYSEDNGRRPLLVDTDKAFYG